MSVEQMRNRLLEWYPKWNVNKFTDEQIVSIYNKERNKIVDQIVRSYS